MDYTEVRFYNDASLNEAIIAWLGENDYDMFEERTDGVNAYIQAEHFDEENLKQVLSLIPDSKENIRYDVSLIRDQNWNTKWESNFEPVIISDLVYVRAPFHEARTGFRHEIIIEPKMSFGTGHHATTTLMIELMLEEDFTNKTVLDMGCGTGILSILAEKSGARSVVAVDIEEWAYFNCLENCEKNNISKISVIKGDVNIVKEKQFDIILANINRNILLNDLQTYSKLLMNGGSIFLSGFLTEDKVHINQRAIENGLAYVSEAVKNNWLAIKFQKN